MNERDVEHRLTKIEQGGVNLQSQIAGMYTDMTSRLSRIEGQMEKQNGRVSQHFADDLAWQATHAADEAHAAGVAAGRRQVLSSADKLLLALAGPALTAAVAGASWLLTK